MSILSAFVRLVNKVISRFGWEMSTPLVEVSISDEGESTFSRLLAFTKAGRFGDLSVSYVVTRANAAIFNSDRCGHTFDCCACWTHSATRVNPLVVRICSYQNV
jgi:hypothetical protein